MDDAQYIQEVLEAWGAYTAEQVPGLGYKPVSVEARMMIFGTFIKGDSSPSSYIPAYMPPHWKAVLRAKLLIAHLESTHVQALECNYVYKYKPVDLALYIGKSKESVKQWYYRAVKEFRIAWYSSPLQSVTSRLYLT